MLPYLLYVLLVFYLFFFLAAKRHSVALLVCFRNLLILFFDPVAHQGGGRITETDNKTPLGLPFTNSSIHTSRHQIDIRVKPCLPRRNVTTKTPIGTTRILARAG